MGAARKKYKAEAIEEGFRAAKIHAGLDRYEVRGALLHRLVQARHPRDARPCLPRRARRPGKRGTRKYDIEYAPLTVGEIRRLLAGLTRPETTRHQRHHHLLHWSAWRRRHQAISQRCHYQRRYKSVQEYNLSTRHKSI